MESRRDVFQAIAEPTRREIMNLVAHRSLNVNSIAEKFNVSRQAVSLHVKILTECGLIVIRQEGRERFCEAKLDKLIEVSSWVEQYRQYWDQKFDALETCLDKLQKIKKHARKNKSFRQDGNQVIHTRLLNAPRELVWDVWTKPEHIQQWWGPDGFTLTHRSMNVQPGQ